MPRISTRATLTVLIVLGAVFALFATVQAASASKSEIGSHLVSGAMVNFNHDRLTANELASYKLDIYKNFSGHDGGGGCESESQINPNDY